MNNRERWVIYPLLVWSLGMGFRSQYAYLFERSSLDCREIRITDRNGKTRLWLGADSNEGGELTLVDSEGAVVSVLKEKEGLVRLKTAKGE